MVRRTSLLVQLAFPVGLIGAIADSYHLKVSGDTTFGNIGIWVGILIGGITALSLVGFLTFVHFRLFAVPEDLFTGSMFGKTEPLFGGNPAIFRQGLVTAFCLVGAGLGFMLSDPIFEVSTLGIGMFLFIPGVAGSMLLIGLWKNRYGADKPDKGPSK